MNHIIIRIRTFARKIGVLGIIKKLYSIINKNYEEKFDKALISSIREKDIIWDVGANLGIYTTKFLKSVGNEGKVIAFEPALECFNSLCTKFNNIDNVVIENIALSSSNKKGKIKIDSDPLAATHQLSDDLNSDDSENLTTVNILTADHYLSENKDFIPNIIKIDVEGFEYDVFLGMKELLNNPDLRAVFCEIHFTLLEERNQEFAPLDIQGLLKKAGFTVKYIDSSHIQALR